MPHWDDAGFQQINCPAFEVKGFAGRQVEGFLDVAHFAWIHTDTLRRSGQYQQVPDYTPAGDAVRLCCRLLELGGQLPGQL